MALGVVVKLTKQDLDSILYLKKKLINGLVVDIKIGYSTMLIVLNEGKNYTVGIGNSKVLIEGKSNLIDVNDIESKLCLGKFFKSQISFLEIDDDGNLSIEFDKGIKKIITKSDKNYESWEINGPDGFQILCMPGGTLAYWMK